VLVKSRDVPSSRHGLTETEKLGLGQRSRTFVMCSHVGGEIFETFYNRKILNNSYNRNLLEKWYEGKPREKQRTSRVL